MRREPEPESLPLKKDVLCQVVDVEPKNGYHGGSVQCSERLGLGTSSTLAQSAQGKPADMVFKLKRKSEWLRLEKALGQESVSKGLQTDRENVNMIGRQDRIPGRAESEQYDFQAGKILGTTLCSCFILLFYF